MAIIKNILFDLGNVLLPISYEACFAAFQKWTTIPIDMAWFETCATDIFELQEVGKLEDALFFDLLRQRGGFQATDEELANAWNAILLEVPKERYQLLERLATRYPLYLLSNTNHIHQRHFEASILRQTGGKPLQAFFVDTYYSHLIGLRKPNTECYAYVLEHSRLKAEETLFIDDNEKNTLASAAMGIPTIHLEKFDRLVPLLEFALH